MAVDEELLDVEMASLFHINTAHLGLRTNLLHMSAAPVYRVYIFIVGAAVASRTSCPVDVS